MTSLTVFCVPEELTGWLQILCGDKQLEAISFRNSVQYGIPIKECKEIEIHSDTYRIFLFPPSASPTGNITMNDVRARERGWIDVRPGHLHHEQSSPIILLSEIHGENFESEVVHPAKYVAWLKRRIKEQYQYGVIGKNSAVGGESLYRTIAYTSKAATILKSGGKWKQFLESPVVFLPVTKDTN